MIRKPVLSGAAALFLLFFSPFVLAQGPTSGRIEGTIRDPNGAVIPEAQVKIVNTTTGSESISRTDDAGNYVALLLPPGMYRVTVTASGFAAQALSPVVVSVTQTTVADAKLEVTGVAETIRVESLVQRSGAELGRLVDSRTISELPLSTRNFTQVLSLSPGVATYLPDSTAVGRNTQTVSVNGARVSQNSVQINGINATTIGTASPVNVAVPAPESIQEFKIQTSLYDASFGRSGGGIVQLVTRSGGNDFHGTAYEYFRNEALNANNPFLKAAGVSRPVLKRNVFGGTLSGPLKSEKAFFFASYQGTRETNGASILNSISSGVLIDSRLTNDRSEVTLKRDFALTAIHPAALALLNVRLPDGQFAIPTPQANGRYFGSSISRFSEDQFNANIDYRFSNQNWASVKFFSANAPFFLSLPSFRGTGANVPGFGTDQNGDVRVFSLQDVHSFSSRLFNEVRVGYTVQQNGISAAEPVNDSDLGIIRSNADKFPGLGLIRIANAAGGIALGTPTNVTPADAAVFTAADTLAINSGGHSLRIGGEFRFNKGGFAQQQFSRGQIDFQDFRSFLTGTTMNSTLGNGIGERNPRALDYNFFFQDDWKVSPRLTLSLGVRYELDLPVYDTRGRVSTFDPALYRSELNAGNPVTPPRAGFVQAGNVIPQYDLPNVPNVSKYVIRGIDANNLAPRVGFAYAPFDSGVLVLRAGYGIFHSRPTAQYSSTSVPAPPGYVLGRGSSLPLNDPFPKIPLPDEFPRFVDGVALSGSVMDRGIRTPYFHQYNGSLQFEIARQTIFEAAYVGTRGLNLFRLVAINQAPLASPQHPIVVGDKVITTNTPGNALQRAPFQGVEINSFFQNQTTAQSSYNSLQLSLTRRLERGLQVLASYTYAKSIDNASGTGGGTGIVGIVNPGSVADTSMIFGNQFDNRANRGVSDFDRTHRFVLSSLWDMPGLGNRDSRVQRVMLRHWQISGIMVAMSGLPIDIVDTLAGSFYGLSGGASPLARPNWTQGFTSKTAAINVNGYFFNPFAYFRPTVPAGQQIPSSQGSAKASEIGTDIGNVGRNVLRGPNQVNVDFSVIKRFPIRESSNLEFRAEFFNLFNHVNFANPISNLNAVIPSGGSINATTGQIIRPGDFGRIISTSNNPRLIQFVAKFNF